MATADKTPATRAGKPLLPPEERFWKRYSPHFELPVAGAAALFAHGVIVGILLVGGLAFLFRASAEASKPAKMDMVAVDKDAAFPGDLGVAPAGEPGYPGEPGRTDAGQGPPGAAGDPAGPDPSSDTLPDLPTLPMQALDVPSVSASSDASADLTSQLQAIGKTAEERSKVPPPPVRPKKAGSGTRKPGKSGTGNPRGDGGARGPGGGIGFGAKGPGRGGGLGAHQASDAEIKAWRWQFDLSGSPRDHADKLGRAGVIVAVPDPKAGRFDPRTAPLLLITDLKRRPVTLQPAAPGQFRDSVKWYNRTPDSVQGLVQELRLPFVPPCVILLMPKDREQKMAELEMRYAQEHGIEFARIQHTTFDFRLQGGVYEPVVINQR